MKQTTAKSIHLAKMPVIQLPELSVEDKALLPKSPGKPQYSDLDHTPSYNVDATSYQEHEMF